MPFKGSIPHDAWHGMAQLYTFEAMWYQLVFNSNYITSYNYYLKSRWMTCLQRSVQSRKGSGIRGTGEQLCFLVFLITYTILHNSGHPIHLKWPQYRSCCTPIDVIYSLPAALVSIPLPQSLSAVCFIQPAILILWKQVPAHPHLPQSSCAVHGKVFTVFTRQIFTQSYRAKLYRTMQKVFCMNVVYDLV